MFKSFEWSYHTDRHQYYNDFSTRNDLYAEISVRRQHFYQRLGFVVNPYAYIHPSFRRPFHPHRLVLMSYPEALTYEEARGFADFIRERVLRYSEHENPELPRL